MRLKNKKNILFLTPQLPYPPYSGGTIKSWKMVKFLSENYNLTVGCFLKKDDKKYLNEFIKKVDLNDFFYEELNKERNFKNYVISLFKNIPLTVYRNNSKSFEKKVQSRIDNYNLIIVDHYVMYQYVPRNLKGKVILHQHNAEYVIWDRLFRNKDYSLLLRILSKLESIRIKKFERNICRRAHKILCVASNDIEHLVKLNIPKDKFELVMSVGDDTLLDYPDIVYEQTEEALLFIGTLSWEPNVDGLIWFIENCWNILKIRFPNLKFYIVGKNPPQKLINVINKFNNIILTGFVENLEKYYSKCRIFISPLRVGSGIKIKNINAMYRGIPVVTTPIGAEGIAMENGKHMFIANTVNDFINYITILLEDKNKWYEISKNSRELAKEKYIWDSILIKLKNIIEGLLVYEK